jgi:hypothetical protein
MHVFPREKGVDIVQCRIEQHGDGPINTNGPAVIEGKCEILHVNIFNAILTISWRTGAIERAVIAAHFHRARRKPFVFVAA